MKTMTLREWRIKRKRDAKDVAGAIGMSLSGYLNIEGGRRGPSRRTAEKIAEYLAIRQEQIIWPIDASDCNISTGTEGN